MTEEICGSDKSISKNYIIKIFHPHLNPPPSRGRKVGTGIFIIQDCFPCFHWGKLTSFLAMTEKKNVTMTFRIYYSLNLLLMILKLHFLFEKPAFEK
jgi:hypothetical protein